MIRIGKISLLKSSRSVFLLIIIFAIAFFFGLNRPGTLSGTSGPDVNITEINLITDRQCNPVQGSCKAIAEELILSLQLSPDARPMKKFRAQVMFDKAPPIPVNNIRVEFRMPDMDMGRNNYSLHKGKDGIWKGDAMLPVCTTGRMDWMARVLVASGENKYIAEYNFSIQ